MKTMGDRFRMNLRRKPGSSAAHPVRARRTVIPPKKDDLSVLTWKEQQMIEKAQLASLKISSQKRVYLKRGRPRKAPASAKEINQESDSESSGSTSIEENDGSDEESVPESMESPPQLSPFSIFSGSKSPKFGRDNKTDRSGRSERGRSSSTRHSPSRMSMGSLSSFPGLLSPTLPATATSSGFAARKSAYTGAIGDSDDDDGVVYGRRRVNLADSNDNGRDESDDDEGPSVSSRRLPPIDSMPTTEDFIKYIVLKGINCVPDELKYIGNLQWETVVVKRKSMTATAKKLSDVDSLNVSSLSSLNATVAVKPEQVWAKKAIERAKRSLTVKRDPKRRSRPVGRMSAKARKATPAAKLGTSVQRRGRPSTEDKNPCKHSRKGPKSLRGRQRGFGRVRSPSSKKMCQGCSKPNCR